jgi:predicted ATP-grasp superfamily ATP-dependent carboligase
VLARVLLTDAEERSVLAACRGLAQAGYRVDAVASSRPAVTHWSRRCATRLIAPDPRVDAEGFVARLEAILRDGEYAILLPGTEASLVAISAARETLERHTEIRLPPASTVARCLDKIVLLAEAERAGLAAPETIVCSDLPEALAAVAVLGYPVMVKPPRSFMEVGGGLSHRSTACASDDASLARAVQGLVGPFLVQRFERNRAVLSCSGVVAEGTLSALAVARYVRTWPPEAGPSCCSETIRPPSGLTQRLEALVTALGWEGIFQVQLLELDDRLAALDLNPRVFGSLALPIGAGANLPAVWCDWVLNRGREASVEARAGIRYRWEEGELRHLLRNVRGGRLLAAAAIAVPRRRVVHAYFERTDPGPLAAWAIGALARLSKRA